MIALIVFGVLIYMLSHVESRLKMSVSRNLQNIMVSLYRDCYLVSCALIAQA